MLRSCWKNAAENAKADCKLCHGTGTYQYDHNHGQVCPNCCKHNFGFWKLSPEYHDTSRGIYCCKAGCGHVSDNPKFFQDRLEVK